MLNIQTSDWAAGLLDFFPQTFMAQPTIITINVPKNPHNPMTLMLGVEQEV